MPRITSAPYANPLAAALDCAKQAGISSDRVARALLSCAAWNDWDGDIDDTLAQLGERTSIVVQRDPHGAWTATLDD